MCNIFPNDTSRIDQDRLLVELIDNAINEQGYLTLTVTNKQLSDEEVYADFRFRSSWRGDLEWLIECSGETFNFKDSDNSPEYLRLFTAPHARDIFEYLKGFGCEVRADLTQIRPLF
jgi:hypothetical protein